MLYEMRLVGDALNGLLPTIDDCFYIAVKLQVIVICDYDGLILNIGPAADIPTLKGLYSRRFNDRAERRRQDKANRKRPVGNVGSAGNRAMQAKRRAVAAIASASSPDVRPLRTQ